MSALLAIRANRRRTPLVLRGRKVEVALDEQSENIAPLVAHDPLHVVVCKPHDLVRMKPGYELIESLSGSFEGGAGPVG